MKRRYFLLALLVTAVGLGAVREFLFLNLNYQIYHVAYGTSLSYAHSAFQAATAGMELPVLNALKWALAAGFATCMLALCILFTHTLTGTHQLTPTVVVFFLAVGVFALLGHLLARYWPGLAPIAVMLLHMLHYPVVLVFVWAGWRSRMARRLTS
jgi:hypothetical protein